MVERQSQDSLDPAEAPRLNTEVPHLVRVSDWRPDSPEDAALPTILWGGVAVKP